MCFILLASLKIYSQEIEIEIDSTFKNSFEIFPFENIDKISSISMVGHVKLPYDTSLVRVILKDEFGYQYLILEAYPLICENLDFDVKDYCDETCYLEVLKPNSIVIQVIAAELGLVKFTYSTAAKEKPGEQRYEAKRAMDANKIEVMNKIIPSYHMNWVAGDNSLVNKYYDQKR